MPDEPNAETRKLLKEHHYDGDPEGQAVQFKHPKHGWGHFVNAAGDFKKRPTPEGFRRGPDGRLMAREDLDTDAAEPTEAQQQAVATGPVTTAGIPGPAPVDTPAKAEKE
jgi:hypothetical protein